ncbi:MAG: ThuA domain-containing protein [Planctomycetales bacterium]|nr:ThuA domain-containing protein [Planctomycetales bacterium]
MSTSASIRVTVWNEYIHERTKPEVTEIYPNGIHHTIAEAIRRLNPNCDVRTATLNEPEHGLSQDVLDATDVLLWWGHAGHDQVADDVVTRAWQRVLEGMGLIVLHSAHASKLFQRLMGTTCMLRWRDVGELERLWIVAPGHPILHGIEGDFVELPAAEMYGEHFDIPEPDQLLLISWFEGGEVFRSGCTFQRGQGRIFYFRPGHETFPIYHHPQVQQILVNAIEWAYTRSGNYRADGRHIPQSLNSIRK